MRLGRSESRFSAKCFVSAGQLLLSTLREIFDEAAYARFLTRQELSSDPTSYAAFLREQESAKARRPKCC